MKYTQITSELSKIGHAIEINFKDNEVLLKRRKGRKR